jgi:uncharacterized membrane protein
MLPLGLIIAISGTEQFWPPIKYKFTLMLTNFLIRIDTNITNTIIIIITTNTVTATSERISTCICIVTIVHAIVTIIASVTSVGRGMTMEFRYVFGLGLV